MKKCRGKNLPYYSGGARAAAKRIVRAELELFSEYIRISEEYAADLPELCLLMGKYAREHGELFKAFGSVFSMAEMGSLPRVRAEDGSFCITLEKKLSRLSQNERRERDEYEKLLSFISSGDERELVERAVFSCNERIEVLERLLNS